jgi:hypothetical protein
MTNFFSSSLGLWLPVGGLDYEYGDKNGRERERAGRSFRKLRCRLRKCGGEEESQRGHMGLLLLALGWGWAIAGICNIYFDDWALADRLLYIFLFLLPGLTVAPIGAVLYNRSWRQ